jgi:hypothetical protein
MGLAEVDGDADGFSGHGIEGRSGTRKWDQWAEVFGGSGSISTQQGGSLQWM